jgi:sugar/nucleoside kinase (ribokinase family)
MNSNIIFTGLCTVDLQFFTDRYPNENEKIKASQFEMSAGGPATNAACTCAHLGSKATLLTAFGENHFSDVVREELEGAGVVWADVAAGQHRQPTFASVISNTQNGLRTIFSYFPAPFVFGGDHLASLVNTASMILVDGFHPDVAMPLVRAAKQKNIPVVFDGGSWKDTTVALLPWVDVAICSEHFHIPGVETNIDTIAYLRDAGVEHVAITRGASPILYHCAGETKELAVPQVDVADTLGAGDVFHGAFCHFFSQNLSFPHALTEASKIAAESCRHHGARGFMRHGRIS